MCRAGCEYGCTITCWRRKKQTLLFTSLSRHDSSTVRGFQGQASDIDIHAREILQARERLNRIFSEHTGQSLETIKNDTERDNFMSANEAKEYGLIDAVLDERANETKD